MTTEKIPPIVVDRNKFRARRLNYLKHMSNWCPFFDSPKDHTSLHTHVFGEEKYPN